MLAVTLVAWTWMAWAAAAFVTAFAKGARTGVVTLLGPIVCIDRRSKPARYFAAMIALGLSMVVGLILLAAATPFLFKELKRTAAAGAVQEPLLEHADRFDLVCAGQSVEFKDGAAQPPKQQEAHYRVDVSAGLFCGEKCGGGPLKLARIDSDELILGERMLPNGSAQLKVNRVTGAWSSTIVDGDTKENLSGMCERKPFSGFQERQF